MNLIAYPVYIKKDDNGLFTAIIPDFQKEMYASDFASAMGQARWCIYKLSSSYKLLKIDIPTPYSVKYEPSAKNPNIVFTYVDVDLDKYHTSDDVQEGIAYPIILKKNMNGFLTIIPDFAKKGQGIDIADSIQTARCSITESIEEYENLNRKIPKPSSVKYDRFCNNPNVIYTYVDVVYNGELESGEVLPLTDDYDFDVEYDKISSYEDSVEYEIVEDNINNYFSDCQDSEDYFSNHQTQTGNVQKQPVTNNKTKRKRKKNTQKKSKKKVKKKRKWFVLARPMKLTKVSKNLLLYNYIKHS